MGKGGVFCKFLYIYISQYLRGDTQYKQEQPPSLSHLFLSWKPDKDGTKMLQRCIFLPSSSCWKSTPVTLGTQYCCASDHHGLCGIWDIQPAISTEVTYELSWITSLPPSYGSYLLLGNKPTFSVDFKVTKEGICFSSWIFNRIGCRTPQNMDKMPSINGLLPSCWEKKKGIRSAA